MHGNIFCYQKNEEEGQRLPTRQGGAKSCLKLMVPTQYTCRLIKNEEGTADCFDADSARLYQVMPETDCAESCLTRHSGANSPITPLQYTFSHFHLIDEAQIGMSRNI